MNRADDAVAYGPADLIEFYNPPPQPAALVVHRFATIALTNGTLETEEREAVANFLRQWPDGPQLPPVE